MSFFSLWRSRRQFSCHEVLERVGRRFPSTLRSLSLRPVAGKRSFGDDLVNETVDEATRTTWAGVCVHCETAQSRGSVTSNASTSRESISSYEREREKKTLVARSWNNTSDGIPLPIWQHSSLSTLFCFNGRAIYTEHNCFIFVCLFVFNNNQLWYNLNFHFRGYVSRLRSGTSAIMLQCLPSS